MVDTFETGLKTGGKTYEFFRYNADHGFVNEQRAATHDRQAAELAWGRAIAFFNQHLNR
jgi:carboxymethylenebutenolidase